MDNLKRDLFLANLKNANELEKAETQLQALADSAESLTKRLILGGASTLAKNTALIGYTQTIKDLCNALLDFLKHTHSNNLEISRAAVEMDEINREMRKAMKETEDEEDYD